MPSAEFAQLLSAIPKLSAEEQSILLQALSARPTQASPPSETPEAIEAQYRRRMEFLKLMESMPDEGPHDGWRNRDHDKLLYGGPDGVR